jgi:hypothetical protein
MEPENKEIKIEDQEKRMLAAFESIAESLKIVAEKAPLTIAFCPRCADAVEMGDDGK